MNTVTSRAQALQNYLVVSTLDYQISGHVCLFDSKARVGKLELEYNYLNDLIDFDSDDIGYHEKEISNH